MAMETIERMSGNIHLQVGRKLQIRTSQILSEITDGEYQDVQMDAASHMTVTTGERSGSTGMSQPRHSGADLFCMRMAAGELLCQEESLPVILDDIFGMYRKKILRQFLDGCIRRKSRLSSVPAVNARWNFWTGRGSLMGSKLFPEFLTKIK